MTEVLLGFSPDSEGPKPFYVADAHNKVVAIIEPDEFWQHGPDVMTSTNQPDEEIAGEQ